MAREVSGTFTGTGNSDTVTCRSAAISLTHAGTATVNLQRRFDGTNWRTVESYTASDEIAYDGGAIAEIRLNCSAHTNDVVYYIRPDAPGRG